MRCCSRCVVVLPLFMSVLWLGLFVAAVSGSSPVAAINTESGVALKGYDPVAYFTAGRPLPGLEHYTYRWRGATYRFASSENLAAFKMNPEQYLPQYGGYCAYAMSINRIADIDPNRWAIRDGKLYLNNNFFAHTLWSINKSGNIASADKNWAAWPKTSLSDCGMRIVECKP